MGRRTCRVQDSLVEKLVVLATSIAGHVAVRYTGLMLRPLRPNPNPDSDSLLYVEDVLVR